MLAVPWLCARRGPVGDLATHLGPRLHRSPPHRLVPARTFSDPRDSVVIPWMWRPVRPDTYLGICFRHFPWPLAAGALSCPAKASQRAKNLQVGDSGGCGLRCVRAEPFCRWWRPWRPEPRWCHFALALIWWRKPLRPGPPRCHRASATEPCHTHKHTHEHTRTPCAGGLSGACVTQLRVLACVDEARQGGDALGGGRKGAR